VIPLAFTGPPGARPMHAVAFVVAVVVAAIATAIAKPLAIKADLVSRPRQDRWARTVIPLGGGAAIFVAIAALVPAFGGVDAMTIDLLVGAAAMFGLGIVDDKYRLSPSAKLVVQAIAACYLVLRGWRVPIGHVLLSVPVTALFVVFVTNATNLLDNMDGSAAGVSAVAAGFVYILACGGERPDPTLASVAAVVAGAAVGFLFHNFPPASIFMGDAGSLLLGFVLSALAVRLPGGRQGAIMSAIVPALVLALPAFDTALVWFARRGAGRPFFLGGRDHTTHRLVALGLSERRTVTLLYAVAAALGGGALAIGRGGLGTAVLVALAAAVALLIAGVFLIDVRVYKATPPAPGATLPSPGTPAARRPALAVYAAEVLVDVAVIAGAWVGAYEVKFDPPALYDYLGGSCLEALPFVIGFKLAALLYFGLYRGFWRSVKVDDLFSIGKAVVLGSMAVVTAAALTKRLENYSREVFVVDALIAFVGIAATRVAMRALRAGVARLAASQRKAVLLGPRGLLPLVERSLGAAGELAIASVLERESSPPGQPLPADLAPLAGEAATLAESAGAGLVLVALEDPRRHELERALEARGLEVRTVSVSVE
jgi:UDP-GlcNAc:undecaprenyl-phosphate GlcNAc-1-phosphate transferase